MSKVRPLANTFGVSLWCFLAAILLAAFDVVPLLAIVFALLGCAVWLEKIARLLQDLRDETLRHNEAAYRRMMEMYADVEDINRLMRRWEKERA